MMLNLKEYVGKKYGRLLIESVYRENKKVFVNCKCDCGNNWTALLAGVKSGKTNSCGCYQREQTGNASRIHGCRWTPTYASWLNMRSRCNIKTRPDYKYYGGRGITICDRWNDYRNFLEDMGEKPEGLTLDRIDNDGNYCKENCKWSTRKEQTRNSRNVKYVIFKGITMPQHELDTIAGIPAKVIKERINKLKWSVEDAVLIPVGVRRNKV